MKYAEYMQEIKYLKINLEEFPKILDDAPIKMWAFCVHDKDTYDEKDEEKNPDHKCGELKPIHVHVMMKFNSDQVPENIAKWFNDKPQYIEKGKSKNPKYMYENMCSYLVHETPNADGKYHYPDDEVIANFDFHVFMETIRNEVKESKEFKVAKHPIGKVLDMICDDAIPRIKIDDYLTNIEQVKYDRDIEKAYRIRDRRIASERIDREMDVIYIFGQAGTGKTTIAKKIAKEKNYSVFVSGSSNDPLEGYLGQECIILDDLRASDWKINDLLKMLDNNTASMTRSRFHNKLMNDCKLMIITSVMSVEDMYLNLQEHDQEPIKQLKRRCQTLMEVKQEKINLFKYNDMIEDYENMGSAPNPVPMIMFMKQNSYILEEVKNMITDWTTEGENIVKGAKNESK